MELWSESWTNGDRMPERFAAGRARPAAEGGGSVPGVNLNPHLAWRDVPAGALSMALICHDFDAPAVAGDVDRPDRELPADLPRADFFHWVLVDLPPQPSVIEEGEYSRGFRAGGKPGPATRGRARQGLNDYTAWFAGDPQRAGRYFGYDGPWPPSNDSLVHHYAFTLYALDIARLPVEGEFSGREVRAAIAGHALAEATFSGTYTLNPRLEPA